MSETRADRMPARQTLVYGSESIDFSLSFSPRRRLSVAVEPDGRVVVKAPADATLESVLDHLRRKAGWILRQRDQFAAYGPPALPKKFVSGETHRYLGRQYRLRVIEGPAAGVKLVGRFFEVTTPRKKDSASVARLLESWYRRHALRTFANVIEQCLAHSRFRRLKMPRWTIQRMKRRWGSCTKEGRILLNLLLIQAPPACIEYVITHELCHLLVHRHDASFYHLLDRTLPDWREQKSRLEMFSVA